MTTHPDGDITLLLNRATAGAVEERNRVADLVYSDLRRIASRLMGAERHDHTLQPTLLATDAYQKLVGHSNKWENRSQFFAVAAQVIRHNLIDYARKKKSLKRGGVFRRVDLNEAENVAHGGPVDDLLALDEALTRLGQIDPRQSQVVELRYFAGLTDEETARVLKTSVRTVKREWSVARAWLFAELKR